MKLTWAKHPTDLHIFHISLHWVGAALQNLRNIEQVNDSNN